LAAFQKAFVLIKATPGHEREVVDELMKIKEVQEAHVVPGEWDVMAVVSAQKEVILTSDQKIYHLVMDKIVRIKHVQDTNTMVSQWSKSK
jgi:DNA-binding Lrp family transcriptional regulator